MNDRVLDSAMIKLDRAGSLEEIQIIVRTAARRLVHAQGATLVLRDGEHCFYADEDAISPLWKGQRFPIRECISGWAMLHRQATMVPDIRVDPRIPQRAYRPTFVRSLVMVPIRVADPLGAVGAYWSRTHRASRDEVHLLATLAETTARAVDRFLPAPDTPGNVPYLPSSLK